MRESSFFRGGLGVVLVAAIVPVAFPSTTKVSAPTVAELELGTAEGVGVTSSGRLFLAPKLSAVARPVTEGEPAQIWSAVADAAGNVYLGTGPDGRVVKVSPSGTQSVLYRTREPLVTAIALLPSGEILAGTAPEGKIYRIRPDGSGAEWADTGQRYVWSIVAAPGGEVFAGTGESGVVCRVDRSGKATPFFDSDEPHIVALSLLPGGGLLAGGSGRGLVYRIDPDGRGAVLHDDELTEARAVVAEPDGSVVAAFVNAPEPERRPPAVRIQVAGASPGATGAGQDAVSELDDRPGPMLQGVIEGLPDYGEGATSRTRGRVVRIDPRGGVTELWKSLTEAPYSLALDASSRPVFGTGEPARVWRVEDGDDVALLATLPEGQVSALAAVARTIVVATSNPASAYRLDAEATDSGTFVSRPVDAGGTASWGTLRWRPPVGSGRVELQTRTGNTDDPDGTWSDWSSPRIEAQGSAVGSPDGRFLQWRARIFGSRESRIGAPEITYATRNRPPLLRDFRLEPDVAATGTKASFRWNVFDPDGDPMSVTIEYRPRGSSEWKVAIRNDAPSPKAGEPVSASDPTWKDGRATWDVSTVEEGTYELRAVASDRGANAPGEGGEAESDLFPALAVDRTPPDLSAKRIAGGDVEIVATDAVGPIARVEVEEDGRTLFTLRPADGVCDGNRESFRLPASEAGAVGRRILRATDAAGNAFEAPVPAP